MQTPSIKRLVVNIAIVVVVAGIFFAAYTFFVKEKTVSVDGGVLDSNENQALIIGTEISSTLKELKDLQLSISASKNIFGMSVFKSLHDFSVAIPEEDVKRENPFLLPQWKVELERRMNPSSK